MRNFRDKFKLKTQRTSRGKWKSPKEKGQEELGADEETPAKIPATETGSESEDYLSNFNTANSEISSWEEDPMDQHPPILPLQTHGTTNTSTGTPTSASDKKHKSLGLSRTSH